MSASDIQYNIAWSAIILLGLRFLVTSLKIQRLLNTDGPHSWARWSLRTLKTENQRLAYMHLLFGAIALLYLNTPGIRMWVDAKASALGSLDPTWVASALATFAVGALFATFMTFRDTAPTFRLFRQFRGNGDYEELTSCLLSSGINSVIAGVEGLLGTCLLANLAYNVASTNPAFSLSLLNEYVPPHVVVAVFLYLVGTVAFVQSIRILFSDWNARWMRGMRPPVAMRLARMVSVLLFPLMSLAILAFGLIKREYRMYTILPDAPMSVVMQIWFLGVVASTLFFLFTVYIDLLYLFKVGNSSLSSHISRERFEDWRKAQFQLFERVCFWFLTACFWLAIKVIDLHTI